MEEIWKVGIGLSGLGGLATFLIYSLYKKWLELPIFQQLQKEQLYNLFKLFLLFTFLFSLAALSAYVYVSTHDEKGGELAEVANFQSFVTAYQEKYEDMHSKLNRNIMTPIFPSITNMTYEEYAEKVVSQVNSTDEAERDIEKVSNFYERILKCEKNNEKGCDKEKIDDYFGQLIHDFWFSYRPYIFVMRKKGYPFLAMLTEKKANNVELKNRDIY